MNTLKTVAKGRKDSKRSNGGMDLKFLSMFLEGRSFEEQVTLLQRMTDILTKRPKANK